MRQRQQYRLVQVAFLFALVGFAFFGAYSGNVLTSQHQPHKEQGPTVTDKPEHGFREPAAVGGQQQHRSGQPEQAWYDKIFDHLPDWFVAFFTLLLVYVTNRLVTSTNKLWEAGERQITAANMAAEAAKKTASLAINVERPYVFVSAVDLVRLPIRRVKDIAATFEAHITFKNYGRTPAFVRRIGFGVTVDEQSALPAEPQYFFTADLTVEVVMRPGDEYKFEAKQPCLFVNEQQLLLFETIGDAQPLVWGQIRFADFAGGLGETGFIAAREPDVMTGGRDPFRFRGPASYTYQRYNEDGSPPSQP